MQIAKWVEQADGSIAWVSDTHKVGAVYSVNGAWSASWYGNPVANAAHRMLPDNFLTAYDACLAAEKYLASGDRPFYGWLESKKGGYFRKFTSKRTVYVRKADNGWYAVQTEGKVLGKGGKVSWFMTAVEACAAVEKETYTPVDADPFVSSPDQWRWLKFRKTNCAA